MLTTRANAPGETFNEAAPKQLDWRAGAPGSGSGQGRSGSCLRDLARPRPGSKKTHRRPRAAVLSQRTRSSELAECLAA